MPIAYFDSSAFLKLIVEEEGSDLTAQLWDGCDAPVSSRLAYPRCVPRSGPRRVAAGSVKLGRQEAEQAWEDFWSATRVVELTDAVARHAGQLATELALRGADAVHLASLLALGVEDIVLAVWDAKLAPVPRQ